VNDLIFRCPSCHKPLKIEEAAAGTRITCPLCGVNIHVPLVRFAIMKGSSPDPGQQVSRQLRQIQRLEGGVKSLSGDIHSLLRRVSGQETGLKGMEQSAAVVAEQLELISRRIAGQAKPSEPPAFRASDILGGNPADSVAWKKLTLVFGGLALLFAVLAVVIK